MLERGGLDELTAVFDTRLIDARGDDDTARLAELSVAWVLDKRQPVAMVAMVAMATPAYTR